MAVSEDRKMSMETLKAIVALGYQIEKVRFVVVVC